jgi:arsenate reductase
MSDAVSKSKSFNVLFLCTGNSCRSQMAEAIMNHLWPDRLHAFSAGSAPRPEIYPETRGVHPLALETLAEARIPARDLHCKSWDPFIAGQSELHFVFTLCDSARAEMGESCPIFPGPSLTTHWGVRDPATVQGTQAEIRAVFRQVFQILHARIMLFGNLPLATLEPSRLRDELDRIGRVTDSADQPV